MLAPDLTYAFRQPKDVSGPTFEAMSRTGDTAATSNNLTFTVDGLAKDKLLALSNVCVVAIPGATQGVISISLSAMTPALLSFDIARFNEALVADLNRQLTWAGQVYLLGGGPGSNQITVAASFDAGVASNRMIVGLHGVVIPRANASPF